METIAGPQLEKGLMEQLVAGGATVLIKGRTPAFQQATDIGRLSVQRVIEAIELAGAPEKEVLLSTADSAPIEDAIRELNHAAAQSPANRLLMDL